MSMSLVSVTFWAAMLCVLCHTRCPHRSVLHFGPVVIYTDWAKTRLARGHRCPCVNQWRYQRIYIRVFALVCEEKDQVLAPWFPRAQKKKKKRKPKTWHLFSVLKKVGSGEWDLLVGNRKQRLNYVLATEQIKGLQNTALNIKWQLSDWRRRKARVEGRGLLMYLVIIVLAGRKIAWLLHVRLPSWLLASHILHWRLCLRPLTWESKVEE